MKKKWDLSNGVTRSLMESLLRDEGEVMTSPSSRRRDSISERVTPLDRSHFFFIALRLNFRNRVRCLPIVNGGIKFARFAVDFLQETLPFPEQFAHGTTPVNF